MTHLKSGAAKHCSVLVLCLSVPPFTGHRYRTCFFWYLNYGTLFAVASTVIAQLYSEVFAAGSYKNCRYNLYDDLWKICLLSDFPSRALSDCFLLSTLSDRKYPEPKSTLSRSSDHISRTSNVIWSQLSCRWISKVIWPQLRLHQQSDLTAAEAESATSSDRSWGWISNVIWSQLMYVLKSSRMIAVAWWRHEPDCLDTFAFCYWLRGGMSNSWNAARLCDVLIQRKWSSCTLVKLHWTKVHISSMRSCQGVSHGAILNEHDVHGSMGISLCIPAAQA